MKPDPVFGHPVSGMHIWGWMSPDELLWLGAQAAQMSSICEIGSLWGRSAYMLAKNCPGPVYCVDPWDDAHDVSHAGFLDNLSEFDNVVAVRGYSPGALDDVPAVDMTFIDGAHDYEQVKADIAAMFPKTRKLICGHDYQRGDDAGFPGVAQAVDEMFEPPMRVRVAQKTAIWYVRLT